MTSCVVRGLPHPREPAGNHCLEGQASAVDLLSRLAESGSEAEASKLFADVVGEVITLAVAGKINEAEEHLKGMARTLGPAILDGIIAHRD